MPRMFAPLAALLLVAAPLGAQSASPIVGKWTVEWEIGRRVENGVPSPIRATGLMTVVASGDSLLATVEVTKRSDEQPLNKPVTIPGRTTAAGASFVQRSEARLNMNGESMVREAIQTWTVRANGDQLEGSLAREIVGLQINAEPTPITGKRVTG